MLKTVPRLFAILLFLGYVQAASPEPYLVKDILSAGCSTPTGLVAVNGTLFFTADDGTHGRELWKSDGTAAGTVLVQDIRPGTGAGSNPYEPTAVNGTLFFSADDGTHGRELWALFVTGKLYLPLILKGYS